MIVLPKYEVVLFQISFARLLGLLNRYFFNKYLLNAILLSTMDNGKKYKIRPCPTICFRRRSWKYTVNRVPTQQTSQGLCGWVAEATGAVGSARGISLGWSGQSLQLWGWGKQRAGGEDIGGREWKEWKVKETHLPSFFRRVPPFGER